ncbi:DUF1800 domain-containing protein [Nocardioides sp. W3-2-3]|nr:DUF1800 domain-containing protein [Nocardioides convexus]
MARRFVSDDPPAALINRLAAVYLANDTQIRPVLRYLMASVEMRSAYAVGTKVRTPTDDVVATWRALGAQAHRTPGRQRCSRRRERDPVADRRRGPAALLLAAAGRPAGHRGRLVRRLPLPQLPRRALHDVRRLVADGRSEVPDRGLLAARQPDPLRPGSSTTWPAPCTAAGPRPCCCRRPARPPASARPRSSPRAATWSAGRCRDCSRSSSTARPT